MAVVGSLTLRCVQRQTLPGGRRLPSTETTEYIQADRKRKEHRGFLDIGAGQMGRTFTGHSRERLSSRDGIWRNHFHVNFDWLPRKLSVPGRASDGQTSELSPVDLRGLRVADGFNDAG
jgi:hypothetical protein